MRVHRRVVNPYTLNPTPTHPPTRLSKRRHRIRQAGGEDQTEGGSRRKGRRRGQWRPPPPHTHASFAVVRWCVGSQLAWLPFRPLFVFGTARATAAAMREGKGSERYTHIHTHARTRARGEQEETAEDNRRRSCRHLSPFIHHQHSSVLTHVRAQPSCWLSNIEYSRETQKAEERVRRQRGRKHGRTRAENTRASSLSSSPALDFVVPYGTPYHSHQRPHPRPHTHKPFSLSTRTDNPRHRAASQKKSLHSLRACHKLTGG